jgi:dihydrofolate reductase
MGRVQYYCASSLDGFIAESDDTLDWLTKYEPAATYADAPDDDAPMPGGYEHFYEGVGALVSGSVTYEFVLRELERGGDWPYTGKPCWILTSRDLPIPDGEGVDIRMVNGAVRDHFDEMMRSAGDKHLWVVGGGNVASQSGAVVGEDRGRVLDLEGLGCRDPRPAVLEHQRRQQVERLTAKATGRVVVCGQRPHPALVSFAGRPDLPPLHLELVGRAAQSPRRDAGIHGQSLHLRDIDGPVTPTGPRASTSPRPACSLRLSVTNTATVTSDAPSIESTACGKRGPEHDLQLHDAPRSPCGTRVLGLAVTEWSRSWPDLPSRDALERGPGAAGIREELEHVEPAGGGRAHLLDR